MTEQVKRWAEFKYEPVGPVVMKLMARYLRTQRKNMRRFFQERGLFTLAERMKQIRNSRQDMLAKNRMFQEVLNDYAKIANPQPAQQSGVPGAVLTGPVLQSPQPPASEAGSQ